MEFCAYCLINMLQNQQYGLITSNNIRYAVAGAYLTIFTGKTMYTTANGKTPLGYSPSGNLFYVKGNDDGTASVIWSVGWFSGDDSPSPATISIKPTADLVTSGLVTVKTNVPPLEIYPELQIQPGEVKILVEVGLCYKASSPLYGFSDDRNCQDVSPKTAFGLLLLNPPHVNEIFFNKVVIFTPKPGLFNETAPQ
jgi:hypothetical protein